MKNCDRALENVVRGRRPKLVNNFFFLTLTVFFLSLKHFVFTIYSRHTSRLANAVDDDELNVLKNNILISTTPFRAV